MYQGWPSNFLIEKVQSEKLLPKGIVFLLADKWLNRNKQNKISPRFTNNFKTSNIGNQ